MQSNRNVAFILAALIAANLATDFVLSWCAQSEGLPGQLFLVAIGVPLSQIVLLAAWLSFGDGGWHWRLPTTLVLAGLVGVACQLSWTIRSGVGGAAFLPLVLIFLMFVLLALFLPLRRIRGWRLTTSAITGATDRSRFQIRDLMLWTIAISTPLALGRLLGVSFSGGATAGLAAVAVFGLLLVFLSFAVMLIAFAPDAGLSSVLSASLTLFFGATATAAVTYLLYGLLIELPGPPGWVVLLQSATLAASGFILPPLVLYANCRALSALGWRLVRNDFSFRQAST